MVTQPAPPRPPNGVSPPAAQRAAAREAGNAVCGHPGPRQGMGHPGAIDTAVVDRALCCDARCGRGTEDGAQCVADTYGRGHRLRLEAAGYRIVPALPKGEE